MSTKTPPTSEQPHAENIPVLIANQISKTSWLNQIEMVFAVVMRKVIRRGNFTSVEDLRGKLLAFIEYFNAVFAKPFRWTYTGRPLQK